MVCVLHKLNYNLIVDGGAIEIHGLGNTQEGFSPPFWLIRPAMRFNDDMDNSYINTTYSLHKQQ
ncbi:hypothetical protein OUZ56_005987 [Daphnia magna]|uniref:Uncharacterized protein n=1 Tax=Daphnia magna TaxID=35525 RepID=A0ABQ9YUC5_9CRUS|nr:hypothetical protein OUZ56_005987 [Daphnia magna]